MYFEPLLDNSAKGLCYVNLYIYPFLLIVLLAVLLCRFPLVACLANRTAALQTVDGSSARLLWESKYLADFKIV